MSFVYNINDDAGIERAIGIDYNDDHTKLIIRNNGLEIAELRVNAMRDDNDELVDGFYLTFLIKKSNVLHNIDNHIAVIDNS